MRNRQQVKAIKLPTSINYAVVIASYLLVVSTLSLYNFLSNSFSYLFLGFFKLPFLFMNMNSDITALSQLSGTALAIAVLIFFVHYFMKRLEKREDVINVIAQDLAQVVKANTNAFNSNVEATLANTKAVEQLQREIQKKG